MLWEWCTGRATCCRLYETPLPKPVSMGTTPLSLPLDFLSLRDGEHCLAHTPRAPTTPERNSLSESIPAGPSRYASTTHPAPHSPMPLLTISTTSTLRGMSTSVKVSSSTTSTATSLSTQLTSCLFSMRGAGGEGERGAQHHEITSCKVHLLLHMTNFFPMN